MNFLEKIMKLSNFVTVFDFGASKLSHKLLKLVVDSSTIPMLWNQFS